MGITINDVMSFMIGTCDAETAERVQMDLDRGDLGFAQSFIEQDIRPALERFEGTEIEPGLEAITDAVRNMVLCGWDHPAANPPELNRAVQHSQDARSLLWEGDAQQARVHLAKAIELLVQVRDHLEAQCQPKPRMPIFVGTSEDIGPDTYFDETRESLRT